MGWGLGNMQTLDTFNQQAMLYLGLDRKIRNLITEAICGFGRGFELISKCICVQMQCLLICLLK